MKLAIAILSGLIVVIGYNLWLFIDCFYECVAIGFVLCFLSLVLKSEKGTLENRIYFVWLFLAINNLIDEIFFDPQKFGVNEYVIALLIIAHQRCQRRKQNARHKQ